MLQHLHRIQPFRPATPAGPFSFPFTFLLAPRPAARTAP